MFTDTLQEFLLDRLEMVLHKASTTFNIAGKIVAIVTDNPNVMEKMRNIFIAKPAYQHILEFRCFAHATNLIAGKFLLFCVVSCYECTLRIIVLLF